MHNLMKRFSRMKLIGLCVALLAASGIIEGKQVAQVQAEQREKYTIDTRPTREVQEQKTTDRFTQTTAHLQTSAVKEIMTSEDPSQYLSYLNIIFDCLAKEQELTNYYVCYHTTSTGYSAAQDVYTQIYARKNPNKKIEDFYFFRFSPEQFTQQSPQDFLKNELEKNKVVDNDVLAAFILSVNLSLFGNLKWRSSSSYDYFWRQKLSAPGREVYEKMMSELGLTTKYIDDLMKLSDICNTKENVLVQIFIPKNKIDQIGYLAWSLGIPKHGKTITWVKDHIKKTSEGSIDSGTSRKKAILALAEQFKKNPDDPIYQDLLKGVDNGEFSLDAFLKVYRNTPWQIDELDHAQGRLLFTPEGLLNPASGIKFFRHSTASQEQLREYDRALNDVVDKIIAESKGGI